MASAAAPSTADSVTAKLAAVAESMSLNEPVSTGKPATSPFKSCAACIKVGTQRCSGCQDAHYCSIECQKKDWPLHKLLCKAFFDFQDKVRPSANFQRAILFPEHSIRPRFVWLDWHDTKTWSEYLDDVDGPIGGSLAFDCHRELRRQLDNSVQLFYRDNFLCDGSSINKALSKLMNPNLAQRWRGPFIAFGIKGKVDNDTEFEDLDGDFEDIDKVYPLDLDTEALGPIVSFLRWRARYAHTMQGYGLNAVVGDGFDPK